VSARIPNRDRPTWISYLQAAFFGWGIYGLGPAIAFLREDLHLSRTVASAHSLTAAAGSVCAGLLSKRLIAALGRGQVLRYASFAMAIGLTAFSLGKTIAITLPGAALFGLAVATFVQGTAAFLDKHQGVAAPGAISELHAMAAGVGMLSPVLIGIGVSSQFGWRPAFLIGVVGILLLEVLRGSNVGIYGKKSAQLSTAESVGKLSEHHDAPGPLPKAFWYALVVMLCTSSTESPMLLWSSELLRSQGHLAKGLAAAAIGCVVGGMFVGRLLGARLTIRFDSENVYFSSLLLSLIGFLMFWLSSIPTVMVIGLTLTGLGMSVHFPLGIARAIRASKGHSDRAAAIVSVGTGVAGGLAPFILGTLADGVGTHLAYAIVPFVLVTGIVITRANRVPLHV
jgi:MFS family permease